MCNAIANRGEERIRKEKRVFPTGGYIMYSLVSIRFLFQLFQPTSRSSLTKLFESRSFLNFIFKSVPPSYPLMFDVSFIRFVILSSSNWNLSMVKLNRSKLFVYSFFILHTFLQSHVLSS